MEFRTIQDEVLFEIAKNRKIMTYKEIEKNIKKKFVMKSCADSLHKRQLAIREQCFGSDKLGRMNKCSTLRLKRGKMHRIKRILKPYGWQEEWEHDW